MRICIPLFLGWASPRTSAEDGTCLLQRRAFFRGRDIPQGTSVMLNATRNRSGHSQSPEEGADEFASAASPMPTAGDQREYAEYFPGAPLPVAGDGHGASVDPGPTDGSSVTLDQTLSGKESLSDYFFSTSRETREINRHEILPDGVIHHTLTEKNIHETADGRTVHHQERHEIYREVRYPTEDGESAPTGDESSDGHSIPDFPEDEEEGGDTEESDDDNDDEEDEEDEEDEAGTYYAAGIEYQTYYSDTPPSADELLEKEEEPTDAADAAVFAHGCYYAPTDDPELLASVLGQGEAGADGVEDTAFGIAQTTSAPGGSHASTSYVDSPESSSSSSFSDEDELAVGSDLPFEAPSVDGGWEYSGPTSTTTTDTSTTIFTAYASCYYSSSYYEAEPSISSEGSLPSADPIVLAPIPAADHIV